MITLLNLFVGLAIFLYGMSQLETAAKNLSGRRLNTWLSNSTRTPVSSAFSGIVLTTILQSSSLVGLIVLAFASAGVIPLVNAIGVLLGANLGTTFTGWLVTFLGFKLDIAKFSLPLIACGGFVQVILSKQSRSREIGLLVLGLGLLLFGLSHMKDSVAGIQEAFSLDSLQGHHAFVYLLVGMALTALIQSSSAMMMLALAALNSQLISLPEAAAVVIGADLGTTSTVILGSLTGNTIKKQLAFAHCFFNVVVDLSAFFLMLPFLASVLAILNVSDPLYGLVVFHSLFNFAGLILFLPFLNIFSLWIQKIFQDDRSVVSLLNKIPTTVPDAAMPALVNSIKELWLQAVYLNLFHFKLDFSDIGIKEETLLGRYKISDMDFSERYEDIKRQEGEILRFTLRLQEQALQTEQTETITRLIEVARAIIYSAKTLKDITRNLHSIEDSSIQHVRELFSLQRQYQQELYRQIFNYAIESHDTIFVQEELSKLISNNDLHQQKMDKLVYEHANKLHTEDALTSTQLNVNREIHHATKNILLGLQTWNRSQAAISV